MNPSNDLKGPVAATRPTAEVGRDWRHVTLLRLRAGLRKWSLWAIDVRAAQRGPKRLVAWAAVVVLHAMAVVCGMVTLACVSPVVILATLFLPQAEAWLATFLATTVAVHFLSWPEVVVFALVQAIVALMVVFIYLGLRGQMRQRIASMGERMRRDPVTGALTRQALHDDFAKMASGQTEPWKSLIFLDVDNFKQVNDRHGHIVGDTCLHMIADRLQNAVLGQEDRLYRYGGDEFLVMSTGDVAAAWRLAEKTLTLLRSQPLIDGSMVTVSLGIAPLNPDASLAENIRRGDTALYRAKLAGRNAARLSRDANAPFDSGAVRGRDSDPPTNTTRRH